jgi:hypothetical protein
MKVLELFSRPGCHLCEELVEVLVPILRGRAELRVVNIDEDIELKKRYGLRIPVLAAGNIELSEFPLDVAAVEAYLGANDADA